MSKIIELYGLPGSGKSTFVKTIGELENNINYTVPKPIKNYDSFHKFFIIVFTLVLRPFLSIIIINFVIKYKGMSLKSMKMALYFIVLNYTVIRLKLSKNQAIYIYDQSVIQYIWSITIGVEYFNVNDVIRLAKKLHRSKPDLVIYNKVSVNEAEKRIISRINGTSHFDKKTDETSKINLIKEQDNLHQIICVFEKIGYEVLKIDGHESPVLNTQILINYILGGKL